MKSQFNLNISSPCKENFNNFSPTPNGGFCKTCTKEVVDFTQMDAQQIITYFKTRDTKNTCGQFKSNQLKTYTQKNNKNKLATIFSSIGLACLSFFSFTTVQAQVYKPNTAQNSTTAINISKFQKNTVVKGNVSENGVPLPGVNIILEGTAIGTQTNFDGDFEFPEKLKKGDVLVFSFVGMQSQKVVIENNNALNEIELKINMKMDACIIMGKVAVKEIYKSSKK